MESNADRNTDALFSCTKPGLHSFCTFVPLGAYFEDWKAAQLPFLLDFKWQYL